MKKVRGSTVGIQKKISADIFERIDSGDGSGQKDLRDRTGRPVGPNDASVLQGTFGGLRNPDGFHMVGFAAEFGLQRLRMQKNTCLFGCRKNSRQTAGMVIVAVAENDCIRRGNINPHFAGISEKGIRLAGIKENAMPCMRNPDRQTMFGKKTFRSRVIHQNSYLCIRPHLFFMNSPVQTRCIILKIFSCWRVMVRSI